MMIRNDKTPKNIQPIYIIFHLHKCGGLTTASHLVTYLKHGQYFEFYKTGNPYFENRTVIKAFLSSLSQGEKNRIRVIMGHGVYYGIHTLFDRPYRYVVFLREPHARTMSNYAYFLQNTKTGQKRRRSIIDPQGHIYPFQQWLTVRREMHDYMVRFLYHQLFYKTISGEVTDAHRIQVTRLLKTFYHVGLLERPMDHWFLYHGLGLPLRAKRNHETDIQFYPRGVLPKDTRRFLTQDKKLYDYFRLHPQPAIPLLKQLTLSAQFLLERIAAVS